jgi:mono/diheme cytochrome c family protein
MASSEFPLPFEQIRWRSARFALTDFRFVALQGGRATRDIAIHDIETIDVDPSIVERLTGIGTLVARSAAADDGEIRIPRVRAARREALRLSLLVAETRGLPPPDDVARLPLSLFWRMPASLPLQVIAAGPVVVVLTLLVIGIGLSGHTVPIAYPPDDAIRPAGVRRPTAEILAFMERDVMPWARDALAPVVGRNRVSCATCHGDGAEARGWAMPGVRALPEPAVRAMAEAAGSDAQVRNALHGYLAEGDNQGVAAYMRGVIVPGMARLLRRPAYDFAQTYEYNRARAAFGCYHCHRVGDQ